MKFTVVSALFFATLAMAAPKQDKGFEVVIHYVDAPDCDYQCGANSTSIISTTSSSTSTESTTTITSTNTKYVYVTLQTNEASTTTLGCETYTTLPSDYTSVASSTAVPTY